MWPLLSAVLMTQATAPGMVLGMDDKPHRPLQEASGKVVGVVFLSHDCPVCNVYAPELARIAKAYKRRGAVIDFVYAEPDITLATAKAHEKAYGYRGLNMFLDRTGSLAKLCNAKLTPEAVVYDRHGHQTYRGRIDNLFESYGKQRAAATTHEFRLALDATLNRQAVTNSVTQPVGCFIASSGS